MLNTYSKWYFGHTIDSSNNILSFNDGSGDKTATLKLGDYTLTEFVTEIARSMNAASSVTFSASVNRSTRLITISAGSSFELSTASGSAANPFGLMGFSGADKTGANTYTGSTASGSEFKPQMKLKGFIDFNDNQKSAYSSVAKSANGTTETVSFGDENMMVCDIIYQTNNNTTGSVIENQANGLDNLRTFMQYVTKKRKVEFIPNRDAPNTFTKCILESTQASGDGTGFRLNEYLGTLPGFFSSGTLTWRKVL